MTEPNTTNRRVDSNSTGKRRLSPWKITTLLAVIVAAVAVAISIVYQHSPREIFATTEEVLSATIAASNTTAGDGGTCECASDEGGLAATFGLTGTVSECCCSFSELEETNVDSVHPLLKRIVQTPYFSHFKVDLCSECQLWDDSPLCMLRDCSVCECEQPPDWASDTLPLPPTGPDPGCQHVEDRIVTTVNPVFASSDDGLWQTPESPVSPFPSLIEGDGSVVVDLKLNPERYTGYSGASAENVWSAVHSTNCFQEPSPPSSHNPQEGGTEGGDNEHCMLPMEQRLYNRIISGLHSSISLHIAHSYCVELDQERAGECRHWGRNAAIAYERVLDHGDRLENLYVAFAMMLQAVVKAGTAITAAVPSEDPNLENSLTEWTNVLLPEITRMAHSCPQKMIDESQLHLGGSESRSELQYRFRHLQQIMQCVGCDRCKLWGTLQTLGIGTALRVLYHDDHKVELQLSRQEAVALVHTLERFSSALLYAHEFQQDALKTTTI